jgi:hypothetical protein
MSDEEEKEDHPTLDYNSLDIESLRAWWAVYERSGNYRDQAVRAKVYKTLNFLSTTW